MDEKKMMVTLVSSIFDTIRHKSWHNEMGKCDVKNTHRCAFLFAGPQTRCRHVGASNRFNFLNSTEFRFQQQLKSLKGKIVSVYLWAH